MKSGLEAIAGLRGSWQTYFETKHVNTKDARVLAEAAMPAGDLRELRQAEDWARQHGGETVITAVAGKRSKPKPKPKAETLRELLLRELGGLGWRGYEQ